MDNLLLLSKQALKPFKITLAIADILCIVFFALIMIVGGWELFYEGGLYTVGMFIVCLFFNFLLLEASNPKAFLKKWPSDLLYSINEECMTGYRCGNGILCENGCLLILGMKIMAVFPQNINMMDKEDKQIFVFDRWGGRHVVNAANRVVRGKGTFQEVDVKTFWEMLSSLKQGAEDENKESFIKSS